MRRRGVTVVGQKSVMDTLLLKGFRSLLQTGYRSLLQKIKCYYLSGRSTVAVLTLLMYNATRIVDTNPNSSSAGEGWAGRITVHQWFRVSKAYFCEKCKGMCLLGCQFSVFAELFGIGCKLFSGKVKWDAIISKRFGSSLTQRWFPTCRVTTTTFCSTCVFFDSFPSKDPAMLTLVNYSQRERISTASSHRELCCQMKHNLLQRWRERSLRAWRAALLTLCSIWMTPPFIILDFFGFPCSWNRLQAMTLCLLTLLSWRAKRVWHPSLFHLRISGQCWMYFFFYPLLIRYCLFSHRNKT